MKTKYYWKVINKDNRQSICTYGEFSLTYPPNQEVFPTLKNSKIFIFNTKKQAKIFAKKRNAKIVKCKANNVTKAVAIAIQLKMKQLWKGVNDGIINMPTTYGEYYSDYNVTCFIPPKGSMWADSITCLE